MGVIATFIRLATLVLQLYFAYEPLLSVDVEFEFERHLVVERPSQDEDVSGTMSPGPPPS